MAEDSMPPRIEVESHPTEKGSHSMSITHVPETPDQVASRLVVERNLALGRLDGLRQDDKNIRVVDAMVDKVLETYGVRPDEIATLSPSQRIGLAYGHLANDLLISELYDQDGVQSNLAYSLSEKDIDPEKYVLVSGDKNEVVAALKPIVVSAVKAQQAADEAYEQEQERLRKEAEADGNVATQDAKEPTYKQPKPDPNSFPSNQILALFSELTSQDGLPGLIAIPGALSINYNRVEIRSAVGYTPPLGGEETNVTFFKINPDERIK